MAICSSAAARASRCLRTAAAALLPASGRPDTHFGDAGFLPALPCSHTIGWAGLWYRRRMHSESRGCIASEDPTAGWPRAVTHPDLPDAAGIRISPYRPCDRLASSRSTGRRRLAMDLPSGPDTEQDRSEVERFACGRQLLAGKWGRTSWGCASISDTSTLGTDFGRALRYGADTLTAHSEWNSFWLTIAVPMSAGSDTLHAGMDRQGGLHAHGRAAR